MDDMEIRKYLLESEKWEKQVEAFTKDYDAIDEENIAVKVEAETKTSFDEAYSAMVDCVTKKISELAVKDDELKLCTLAPNKVKDSVVYPPKFTGKETEDVYSFIKEFRQAIASDHVKKADEVKKLKLFLDGRAKDLVGDHHRDLETALEILKSSYGNPHLIWNRKVDKYDKDLQPKIWG